MANEIKISGAITVAKGAAKVAMSGTSTADMAGDHYIHRVDSIGATEESVSKGDVATIGFCAFRNLSESGTVSIGGVTGAYVIELSPGEFAGPLFWSTNAIFAVADVAGTLLELLIVEA